MTSVIIIKLTKFSYSSFESQLLPYAPACDYKFHALAVQLQPTFTAPFQLKVHLEYSRRSAVKLFCENTQRLQTVGYFCKRAPSWMFDVIPNATLSHNLLKLAEGLKRSFLSLGLHKGIFESPCLLILLICTKHKTKR